MINGGLFNERVVLDNYSDIMAFLGKDELLSWRILEGILKMMEEYSDELVALLEGEFRWGT